MKNPRNHGHATLEEFERRLIQAGRASAPAGGRQRAFAAAAGVLGGSALTGTSAAATGVAGKAAAIVSLKWVVVAGLAGIAAASGTVVAKRLGQERTEASPVMAATAQPVTTTMAIPVPPTAPVASADSSEVPAAASTPRPSLSEAPSASAGSSFPAEFALVDGARAAIAAREPARALSMLDRYSERFPRGIMAPEAAVLRVEALVAAGDREAARRAGGAFLRSHPSSPYGPRIQSLLGSNP